MKSFTYNGKTYNFAQDVIAEAEGKCAAILTSEDNVVCELTFVDGVLESIKEIG